MLRGFYKASIICFYFTMGLLILGNIADALYGYERLKWLNSLPLWVRVPLGVLGAFSAFGISTLWLGMIWDCAFVRRLPAWSRAMWLATLVLINCLGALIYYYRVFEDRSTKSIRVSV
jgi:hypothetical protein